MEANAKKKILIVEDEKNIAQVLAYNIKKEGYDCTCAYDGETGLTEALSGNYDLILLDIMLPRMNGFEVCEKVRLVSQIPIIFVTAREEEKDKILGLDTGADDYVTKPFSPKELVLRVRNVLSRANAGAAQLVVRGGPLVLDKNTLAATLNGAALDLTTAEFKLLAYLMERPGKVQDRYELQKVLFGYADTTQSRALDTHVKRLRQKLGDYAGCIGTERGVGYYFNLEPEEKL